MASRVNPFLISNIAFHGRSGSHVVIQKPAYREFISEELNDFIYGPKKPEPTVADLDSDKEMSWEVWSWLIDQKLFGHETPFSRIPKQQAGL